MFTSSIIQKSFAEGNMQVVVQFTDGTDTITKAFNIGSEGDLKGQVRREAARLTELSAFSQSLPNGAYNPTDTPPTPPTQAEIDKQEWFRDFNRLERVKKLQELGGMPVSWDTYLTTLATKVQTSAKKAYIADM